jgi:myosin-3
MASKKSPGQTDNLADHENLDEETLLHELEIRFNRDQIYTYVGEILVSMNPFKAIEGLYDNDKLSLYRTVADKAAIPPHVYATASMAYDQMFTSGKDQVCVISGESGAGKTEAAKSFIKQLVNVSKGAEFDGLEEKLLSLNPVLEAFGNAKTKFNNNSSRFGKYTSVEFNGQGQVKGATMTEYLLEKSRVIQQGDGEQNFHVFYLFFQGLGKNPDYAAGDPSVHRFVDGNDTAVGHMKKGLSEPKGKQGFEVEFEDLVDCFKIVGFTQDQQDDIFHTISGITHLGDIEFDGEDGAEDGAKVVSEADILEDCCAQLGITNSATLDLALTQQNLVVGGEEVIRKLKVEGAEDVRDATAKAIYTKVFSWIVAECNSQLKQDGGSGEQSDDTKMGILDIFGFECFESNSLEQLCINLTNEQLQWYFNEFIFAMELKEYAAEGITGKDITYEDNQGLLDLLMHSKPNLYGELDQQCIVPRATDSSMIVAFHTVGKGNKDYKAPRGNEDKFTLSHYAGDVTYDGHGFLEKNKDTLAADVVACLRMAENDLIKKLFNSDAGSGGGGGGRRGKRGKKDAGDAKKRMRASIKHARTSIAKKPKKTTGAIFKQSLLSLKDNLMSSQPHFIRTIKPNHAKKPKIYEHDLIMRQLRYTGMLETTRIRREGYSSRPLFADFVHRYKVLGFPCRSQVAPTAQSCRQILDGAGISGFEVGKTKVFMRYFHADELNEKLHPYSEAATTLSKYCRGYTARSKYGALVAEKRAQDEAVKSFINSIERSGQGVRDVVTSLCEEDTTKHPRQFGAPPPVPVKQQKSKKKGKGMARAASVKWFKEEEATKGSGKTDDGGFADWFHGIITRIDAEALLNRQAGGTFLIRVAESRFGYSLSLMFNGRCKHFMIDQNDQDRYLVVGNDRTFPSLNEVVAFHMKHPVTDDGDVLIKACPVDGPREDLAELQ